MSNTTTIPNYKNFQEGKFDPAGSTFRHEIYLKPSQKLSILYGYSANVDKPEAKNKTYAIKSVMKRILPRYFHKMLSIKIYKRHDLTRGWTPENETCIARITCKGVVEMYESQESRLLPKNAPAEYNGLEVGAYFTEIAYRLYNNLPLHDLKVKRPKTRESYYKELISTGGFDLLSELIQFCKDEIARKEEVGLIDAFFHKYKLEFFPDEKTDFNPLHQRTYDFSDVPLPTYIEKRKEQASHEPAQEQELKPNVQPQQASEPAQDIQQASQEPNESRQEPQGYVKFPTLPALSNQQPAQQASQDFYANTSKYEPKQRQRAFKPLTPEEREAVNKDRENIKKENFLWELAYSSADIKEKVEWYEYTLKEKITAPELEKILQRYDKN